MRLVAAVALLLAIAASPTAGASRALALPSVVAGGYGLYPAPPRLADQCARAQQHVRFTVLCPTLMPRTGDGTTPATAYTLPQGDAGVAATTFAQWSDYPKPVVASWLYVGGIYGGGETDPQDWSSHSPNYFFHFFVDEGDLSSSFLNLSGVPYPQKFLGRRTIAGHAGKLYDQVSYSICGECSYTGHVTFIWHQHGVTYAASLHRWSATPNGSVLAVLAALIKGLKPVR
jgi:hypothetical protein